MKNLEKHIMDKLGSLEDYNLKSEFAKEMIAKDILEFIIPEILKTPKKSKDYIKFWKDIRIESLKDLNIPKSLKGKIKFVVDSKNNPFIVEGKYKLKDGESYINE